MRIELNTNKNREFTILIILMSLIPALMYQVTWSWPFVDTLPCIERLLDSEYLNNDFYTNTFGNYSARHIISYLIIFGSKLFNTDYFTFITYANIVKIFLSFLFIGLIFKKLSLNNHIALIATFITSISFIKLPFTVGWGALGGDFSAQFVALLFTLIAIYFLLDGYVSLSLIFASLSVLIHPIIGIHTAFILLILYMSREDKDLISELKKIGNYLGLILFMTCFLFNYVNLKKALGGYELDLDEFNNILAYFRHPHHYIPSQFGIHNWFYFVFSVIYITFIYIRLLKWSVISTQLKRIIQNISIYLIVMFIAGFIFVEIIPIKFFIQLIPFRSMFIFKIFFQLIWAMYLYKLIKSNSYISLLLILSINIPMINLPRHIVIAVLLVSLVLERVSFKVKIMEVYSSNLIFLAIILLNVYSFVNLHIDIPNVENKNYSLYNDIKRHTESDKIILAEKAIDKNINQKIRILSKRAVVISDDFPFIENYYLQWYNTYREVYGSSIKSTKGIIDSYTKDKMDEICTKYNVTYVLRKKQIDYTGYSLIEHFTINNSNCYLYKVDL